MNWNWLKPRRRAELESVPERKALPLGFVQMETQGTANWTRRDAVSLTRASYLKNPVAYRAVRLVAQSVADVPWVLTDASGETLEHPLIDLLAQPNSRQDRTGFLEALVSQMLLSGNGFVELAQSGGARELHVLRSDRVSIETDASGWPVTLVWKLNETRRRIALEGDSAPAPARHFALYHPLDDVNGFAPVEAAAMAVDIHNGASEWNKALIDNSARPSGALVYQPKDGGNLTGDQFERLKGELEEGYQGARRAGRPLLLEGGLDWKPMGLTPKDMDFFEAKNAAARDIALAFGVPPLMLGLPGDATFNNYKEANRAFFRLTVLPFAARLAEGFSNWLGEGTRFTINPDGIDALAEDRESAWRRIGAADFLTEAEKREAAGYAPLPADGGA